MSSQTEPLALAWIERIFMRLHGRFGNAFLDKYRIGELNDGGKDLGVENAKQVWAEELAGVTVERLKAGLMAKYDYPPSCDEFLANCVNRPEIQNYKRLPRAVDNEVNRAQADKIIELVQNAPRTTNFRAWAEKIITRHKGGDKTVEDIALRFANQAVSMQA